MGPVTDLVAVPRWCRVRSRTASTLPPSSGWRGSMPESMMPTITPAPRLRSHAAGNPPAQVPLVLGADQRVDRRHRWIVRHKARLMLDLALDLGHTRIAGQRPAQLGQRCSRRMRTLSTPTSGMSGRARRRPWRAITAEAEARTAARADADASGALCLRSTSARPETTLRSLASAAPGLSANNAATASERRRNIPLQSTDTDPLQYRSARVRH